MGDLTPKIKTIFILLVAAQAAHSFEEIKFELWQYVAPSRWIGELFHDDVAVGFAIANGLIVAFGLWCYFARVRPGHRAAKFWITIWALVEVVNGLGHPLVVFYQGRYFPGVYTAPLLLVTALYILVALRRGEPSSSH